MGESLFGTDGIRGRANVEPLVPERLAAIGRALGETLIARGGPPSAVLGRDPRSSGPMVGSAVLSGLLAAGVDVRVGGVLPTPAVARIALADGDGIGVVVSASHNPADDNGVKVFLGNGRKADDGFAAEVEERLAAGPGAGGGPVGRYRAFHGARDEYVDLLLADFPGLDLSGLTVLVDAANGATHETAPAALERLGAEVIAIHASPDGQNINEGCGALHPEAMAAEVAKRGADAGVSFDGDGDRAIFADETGRILDGDATMAILARDLLARGRLAGETVVVTVMSNLGLTLSLEEAGARLVRTPVGDRFVVEEMDHGGFALGGEQSGHVIVRSGNRLIGDGLETALHLLEALRRAGGPLSGLGSVFSRAPQTLLNVRVREKPELMELPGVAAAVKSAEERLGGRGRILLRYSGTEPLARVMVEANDASLTRDTAESIAAVIQSRIGSES